MNPGDELITRPQADTFFAALFFVGLVAGPLAWGIARRRGSRPLPVALLVGGGPVLVGLLWRVYNALTDRIGLDTVANLAVNLGLFIVVGAGCGVGWALLHREG